MSQRGTIGVSKEIQRRVKGNRRDCGDEDMHHENPPVLYGDGRQGLTNVNRIIGGEARMVLILCRVERVKTVEAVEPRILLAEFSSSHREHLVHRSVKGPSRMSDSQPSHM